MLHIANETNNYTHNIEDTKGDNNQGIRTLPVVFGISKTSKLVFILSFVPVLCILYYVYNYLFHLQYATIYIFGFLVGPLLYFMIKIWSAETKKDFQKLNFDA